MGSAFRHRFGDDGLSGPVEFHAGLPATVKEIEIATAQKIEAKIECGIGQPCKHRPDDQAIATAINDRNRPADIICRPECRVTTQATLGGVIEIRKYRPADHIRASRLRGMYHPLKPISRG